MKNNRTFTTLAAAASTLALLAGCSATGGDATTGSADADALQTVADGTLTVGLSPDFPPLEYLDGDDLIGSDVDIVTEVADRLGLEIVFEQSKFDQLINSVRTERVDIVVSGMSDTVERQETLDFVDYFASSGRFYTTGDQAAEYTDGTDICGASVAVSTKTDYYPALQEYSADTCEAAGLDPIEIVGADSGAAARLQLDQGRAQVAVQGAPNLAYFEEQDPGAYKIVGPVLVDLPFGAAVAKGNTALAEAVQAALQEMYDDGTTEDILTEYDLADGLMEPVINGVTE